jgi:NADPH:quinone reductase-like Zn-dependent oxidoreductase
MLQVVVSRFGGPEVLRLLEAREPEPAADEVRIRVVAAGINFGDLFVRMGLYPGGPRPPFVPGFEVSGHIDAVGTKVGGLRPGDAVFALTNFGGYAEAVVVAAAKVFRLPQGMSLAEGAAWPAVFITAHHAMITIGNLQGWHRVLIHSAGGGVGTAAVQIAKALGAVTFGTSSASKHERLQRLGLDRPIDYTGEDFEQVVRRDTGGQGVHLILDPSGGANWRKNYRLLAPSGRLCVLGFADVTRSRRVFSLFRLLTGLVTAPRWHPLQLMNDNRGVFGIKMSALWEEDRLLQDAMEALQVMFERRHLRPVVDRAFTFADAAAAHVYLHEGRNFGKALLIPGTRNEVWQPLNQAVQVAGSERCD